MSLPKPKTRILFGRLLLLVVLSFGIIFSLFTKGHVFAQLDSYVIFQDSLSTEWTNWSWSSRQELSESIAVNYDAWGGLYLHANAPIDTSTVRFLQFRLQKPDQAKFRVFFYDTTLAPIDNQLDINSFVTETRDGLSTYRIPMDKMNVGGRNISGLAIQEISGNGGIQARFDDIMLLKQQTATAGLEKIFIDGDGENWENWSWGGSRIEGETIGLNSDSAWAGIFLHRKSPMESGEVKSVSFKAQLPDPSQYQIALFGQDNKPLAEFSIMSLYRTGDAGGGWATYTVPSQVLFTGEVQIQGLVLQDISGVAGKSFSLDEVSFVKTQSGFHSINPAPTLPAAEPDTDLKLPTSPPSSAKSGFSTGNNKLYKNGQEITLRGVNWFGFETETYAPHGLWSRNWKEMIAQMKQSGFNSVRIPFCPATLKDMPATGVDIKLNPDLDGVTSLRLMDTIVAELNNQGMFILLDHHRPDCQAISQLWYTGNYSEEQWIKDLVFLAERYKNVENLMGIDLKNEPHGPATWGTGNSATDWNKAAEKAGRAILTANSNVVIFVEGIQENPTCSGNVGHWMGGNMEPIRCTPIDSGSIPANKLVLSPHVYGPDVYPQGYFSDGNFPSNMPAIWDAHFGSLASDGYTIVPGEWGGKYGWGDAKDKTWQDAMANYFVTKRICNSYYWSWNPNSGDTGGILQDDWTSVRTDKLELLKNYWSRCQ